MRSSTREENSGAPLGWGAYNLPSHEQVGPRIELVNWVRACPFADKKTRPQIGGRPEAALIMGWLPYALNEQGAGAA